MLKLQLLLLPAPVFTQNEQLSLNVSSGYHHPQGFVENRNLWLKCIYLTTQNLTWYHYQNFAQSKVCGIIPAFMFHSASLFLTLEISSSHWSMSTSDWLFHMFVCCLLWPERQSLSTFDVRTVYDLIWEHRHWWTSQLTYLCFSVIGGSSYQTLGNKIIIKDICSGDSTFIIAQASTKPLSLVHARPTVS